MPRFALRTVEAPAVEVGPVTVTPVARSIVIGWGGGALVRSWPSALLVAQGERTFRRRIIDVTRWAQVLLLGATMLCVLALVVGVVRRKEKRS